MTRKTLSLDEHRKLAASLRSIRRGISEIYNTISGCRLTTRVGQKVYGVELKLRAVKNELELVMVRDHRGAALADLYCWRDSCETAPTTMSTSDRIVRALRSAPAGLTRTQIATLFNRRKSSGETQRALLSLHNSGLARFESIPTQGRPVERWFAV